MSIELFLIALAAGCATFLGGLFALRYKDKRHLILGFSAGAVLGVAFFDLLPESVSLISPEQAAVYIALGFVGYLLLDRTIGIHAHTDHDHTPDLHEKKHRGVLRAFSLCIHSFFDGIAIGVAFQISNEIGIVIASAVLVHDFSDGINTVGAVVKSGYSKMRALRWLAMDAIAPIAGIIVATSFSLSETTLGIVLSLFCGFFLYIGASDLVPESYHAHPTRWTTIATIIGMSLIFIVIHFAHAH